jgi:D-alanyl-D-alanine endopeptidase (penicillin-binding protein 7)
MIMLMAWVPLLIAAAPAHSAGPGSRLVATTDHARSGRTAGLIKVAAEERSHAYVSADAIRKYAHRVHLKLRSYAALVYDERDQEVILDRHAQNVMPIASLTKLMTAMVVLDAGQPMDAVITITKADKDRIRYSRSRLRRGMKFTRKDLLLIALVASENRAALALARTYPGGTRAFVAAMNSKARRLGLTHTHYTDPAGLGNGNVSNAYDLLQIVKYASQYFTIREFTTQHRDSITNLKTGREVKFGNTNRLVRYDSRYWPITLSKTGFTDDAGNCLVMQTKIHSRPVIIVLLDSWGKLSKYGDSIRIKRWLLRTEHLASRLRVAESS